MSAILFLSVTPHPNSKVTSEVTFAKQEIATVGEVAYMGEEFIGEFSDKYRHLIAFWTLAFLLDFAYKLSVSVKIVFLSAYGGFIELVQYVLPYRDFDMYDVLFNILFVVIYYISVGIFTKNFILKRNYFGN